MMFPQKIIKKTTTEKPGINRTALKLKKAGFHKLKVSLEKLSEHLS